MTVLTPDTFWTLTTSVSAFQAWPRTTHPLVTFSINLNRSHDSNSIADFYLRLNISPVLLLVRDFIPSYLHWPDQEAEHLAFEMRMRVGTSHRALKSDL
ncbi:Uncharacterized protein HZ326_29748 [Fusarium oxysporum f. sp. albedinis]|nr:Uncharacterized protein HZ326_29748 [Fusarium oxysporum f. sp. albedinis]